MRAETTVTLVRPSAYYFQYDFNSPATPPVGLAYVAAAVAAHGYRVHVVDGLGENPEHYTYFKAFGIKRNGLSDEEVIARIPAETTVIGVSCMFSYEWPFVRNLIERTRERFPDAVIVAGGEHATAMPSFVLDDCPDVDVVVRGEGEDTICELLDTILAGGDLAGVTGITYRQDGAVVTTAPRRRIRAIDDIPRPRWDLVPIENFLDKGLGYGVNRGRSMPIVATRGCPYQCTFCSNPGMWTTMWRPRDPDQVLDEIEDYIRDYGATNIDFYDLTLIVDPRWLKRFARRITERGLTFTWQLPAGTRSEAVDAEVAGLLYQTGCRNLNFAPESGSPRILKRIKKKVDPEHLLESMRACLRAGLNVKVNFIVGFPDETMKDLTQTLWLIVRMAALGAHDCAAAIFTPYPGSELFDEIYGKDRRPIDDRFFLSLGAYTDMSRMGTAWSRLNPYVISLARVAVFLTFYAVSFVTHPSRLFKMAREIFAERQTSRGAMALKRFVVRTRETQSFARPPRLRYREASVPAADPR